MLDVGVLCLTLLVLLVCSRILKLVRGLKSVDHLTGIRCFFAPIGFPGVLLPTTFWNPGLGYTWHWRSSIYKKYKSETISVVPFIVGRPIVYTSSPEVAQRVLGSTDFYKSPDINRTLSFWGVNILASDGETYKRHRRIVGPAFSGGIAPLVWEETFKAYQEMLAGEGWVEKNTVTTDRFNDYAQKLALVLISRCAFGLAFPWTGSSPSKGDIDLVKCMSNASSGVAMSTYIPRWMYKLPVKRLRETGHSFTTLDNFMKSIIASQRAQIATSDIDPKNDLFSRLIEANKAQGKLALDDDELVGNVFAFLLAGEESTARSIAATLALMAVHPEEQDIAAREIQRVLVNGREPVFNDSYALTKVQACFLETIRMFPAAYLILRDTASHVKLTAHTEKGDTTLVLAPETRVVVDMIGICYNPRHFPEPETYKPSRWYNTQDSDLIFFGMGPRACIGRKFAMTEALCFLTLILRDWVVSPLLRDGETITQWRSRVIRLGPLGITFGLGSVPLKFTRRVSCGLSMDSP